MFYWERSKLILMVSYFKFTCAYICTESSYQKCNNNVIIFYIDNKHFKTNIYKMLSTILQNVQARQTRPNSGGVAEGHPRFDKGGVAIIFYFLRVKNRTF